MKKITYLVLLRGINVGGNNIIKMDVLKKFFEKLGFSDVKTFIQSGNVIFNDFEKDKNKIKNIIENKIFEEFNSEIKISLFTLSDMDKIINIKPEKFGEDDKKYRYNVLFFIEPLTSKKAFKEIGAREGVDEIYEDNKVIYYKTSKENITKTYLTKIIGTSMYKNITIRGWNTVKKLYELMENTNKTSLLDKK